MFLNSPVDDAFQAHLVRLLVAGGLSVAFGLGLAGLRPGVRAFGLMNAAWGAVDLVLALSGFRETRFSPDALRGLLNVMILNMGFNGGYVAVGITMMALAGPRKVVLQSGAAVIVQGIVLLALDGYFLDTVPFWLVLPR